MGISELLAKKAAADAATASVQPKILAGVEGSVAAQPPAPKEPETASSAGEDLAKQYKGYPEGSYLMLRQKHLILASGAKVKADKLGVITPANEEEKKILEYLLKQDRGLVALIPTEE